MLRASGGVWSDYATNKRNAVFFVYGRDFLRAAQKTGSPLVRAYLLGHALELLLKAYLLTCGVGEKALKRLGHDLVKLVSRSAHEDEHQFPRVSSQLTADLERFSVAYRSKAFQYFSILHLLAPPRVPDLGRIMRFARVLEKKVQARVRAALPSS